MSRLADSRLQVIHILQKQLETRPEPATDRDDFDSTLSTINENMRSTLIHTGVLSLLLVFSILCRIRYIIQGELTKYHSRGPWKTYQSQSSQGWIQRTTCKYWYPSTQVV